jgi:hypothetical protein
MSAPKFFEKGDILRWFTGFSGKKVFRVHLISKFLKAIACALKKWVDRIIHMPYSQ